MVLIKKKIPKMIFIIQNANKKAFTLLELIIVLIIVGLSYYLIISTSSIAPKKDTNNLSLSNIKEYIIKNFEFKKNICFFCIEKDLACYIKVDNKIQKDFEIKNFFSSTPSVYEYSDNYSKIDFLPMSMNEGEEKVIFELMLNSDFKHKDFIVDTGDKFYLFNSIYDRPIIFDSFGEVFQKNQNRKQEIKYAF